MLKKCKNCGKEFEGNERQFCSWQCDEKYKALVRQKLGDAMKNDKGHTSKLSSEN